jgi:hypothetical protein
MASRTSSSQTKSTGLGGAGWLGGAGSMGHSFRQSAIPSRGMPPPRRARKRSTTSAETLAAGLDSQEQDGTAGRRRTPRRAKPGSAPRRPPLRCGRWQDRPAGAPRPPDKSRRCNRAASRTPLRACDHVGQALDVDQVQRADVIGGGIVGRRAAAQRHGGKHVGGDAGGTLRRGRIHQHAAWPACAWRIRACGRRPASR